MFLCVLCVRSLPLSVALSEAEGGGFILRSAQIRGEIFCFSPILRGELDLSLELGAASLELKGLAEQGGWLTLLQFEVIQRRGECCRQ
jgi:hypothetical protein